ncbi:hypothetical protein ACJJIG_01470 [Microbulbifer sp. SSSA007]|uniref:hypothetical protein n=1 Tax=Microbulbifer sp. SSSA007 TaxID=3243379 RepID=UPI004039D1AB
MKIISLSSRKLEQWWKFIYLYLGIFIFIVFVVGLFFVHWNINNPQINQGFVQVFRGKIPEIYFFLGAWLIILFFLRLLFSRLVQIQVDEQRKIIYVDGVEQNIDHVKYISEVTIFSMLVVFIKREGHLQVWIPKDASQGGKTWPLPFFLRKIPRNKYVKLFVSLLGSPSKG